MVNVNQYPVNLNPDPVDFNPDPVDFNPDPVNLNPYLVNPNMDPVNFNPGSATGYISTPAASCLRTMSPTRKPRARTVARPRPAASTRSRPLVLLLLMKELIVFVASLYSE